MEGEEAAGIPYLDEEVTKDLLGVEEGEEREDNICFVRRA